jgi:hypothetical protein
MNPEDYLAVLCPTMLTVSGYSVFIDMAEGVTSSGFFGSQYNLAVALRAAHMYVLNRKRGGEGGFITQKVEGRMSVSYGGVNNVTDELQLTSYGMQLYDLIKNTKFAGTVSDTAIYNTYLGG